MVRWFLIHLWKQGTRSTNFSKSLVLNLILGFFLLITLLYVLMLGLFMDRILADLYPEKDPVWVFNSALLYYVFIDLLLRFLLQNLPRLNIDMYLHLPIKRSTIVHYIILRTCVNFLNVIPLLVFIPFALITVKVNNGSVASAAWFWSLFFIILGNNFLGTYIKRLLASRPLHVAIMGLVVLVIILLDYFDIISLSLASAEVFGAILANPAFILLPLFYMIGTYILQYRYLNRRLYTEELETIKRKRVDAISRIKYFKSLGYFGTLLSIDLKLIWRNKRTRSIVYMAPLFLLYGFFFYPQEIYINMTGMLIFVGIFMTGGMMINYCNFALAYESNYFDSLLANRFDFKQYFRMKYINAVLICTVCYILTIPYVFFGTMVLLINTVTFLFNIGVITFTLLYIATHNKKRMDMSRGSTFNYQGMGASNWLAMIPAFLIPVIIYLPFSLASAYYTGLIFIGIMGLVGLLFHKTFLNIIYKNFITRRYIMADGFREK